MKLATALLSFALGVEALKFKGRRVKVSSSIKSSSKLGKNILKHARRLDDGEVDTTFMQNYDLKFQGCYETSAWNPDAANDAEEVRIMKKRLARFRMCPTGYCDSDNTYGCQSSYGDYVVDLNQFLDTYTESKLEEQEYMCEQLRESCGCGENDQDDDEEACEYNCYTNAGMQECIEDEDEEEFELQKYTMCGELEAPEQDDDNNRRRGRKLDEEEEAATFMGPYCSSQGGAIYFGIFTEETCSVPYDSSDMGESYYYNLYGESIPYGTTNLVGLECNECAGQVNDDNRRRLDYEDNNGNPINAICYESYFGSAKCETNMNVNYPNTYGCNFMEGIKIVRSAGTNSVVEDEPSKAASAFIGVFAVSFIVLGAYVYYLKTKLDKTTQINLAE